MLGGILHTAGYHMGGDLHLPNAASNPKGFFESAEINDINEQILAGYDHLVTEYTPGRLSHTSLGRIILNRKRNPRNRQRWLCSLSPDVRVDCARADVRDRIRRALTEIPFCYKDPRFSYTLPVWEPYLPESTCFVCIFRDPAVTVRSIIKETRARPYLQSLRIDETQAYAVYCNIYSHVLRHLERLPDRFFFVHYDQIFNGAALPGLEELLGTTLSVDFVEPQLKRTVADSPGPESARRIHARLCELAGHAEHPST